MASFTSQVEALLVQAKQLDSYLEQNNIPYPSTSEDTLGSLPKDVQSIRHALADSANEVRKLARGPVNQITELLFSWAENLAMRLIYQYNLPSAVPLTGSASYAEIASACGLNQAACTRALRIGMIYNMFDEDESGRVVHTALSRQLVTQPGFRDYLSLHLVELQPTAPRLLEAWGKYGQDVQDPAHTAWSITNNTDKAFYVAISEDPERAMRFGKAMGFLTKGVGLDIDYLLEAWDWKSIDKPGNTVFDIGGGQGQVSIFLARNTKELNFVVKDTGGVVAQGKENLPEDVKGRVGFEAHDFFVDQPAGGSPKAIVLRWILHNWADSYVVKILKALVPAMSKDTKVLVFENILSDRPRKDFVNKVGQQIDMAMTILFNSKERYVKELEELLQQADPRFVVDDVRRQEGTSMGLVVIGWTSG